MKIRVGAFIVLGLTAASLSLVGCQSKAPATGAGSEQQVIDAQKAAMEKENPGSTQPGTAPR